MVMPLVNDLLIDLFDRGRKRDAHSIAPPLVKLFPLQVEAGGLNPGLVCYNGCTIPPSPSSSQKVIC